MVDRAEYKRRQYPPGPKISTRNFGRDRRLPITNAWRETRPEPRRSDVTDATRSPGRPARVPCDAGSWSGYSIEGDSRAAKAAP